MRKKGRRSNAGSEAGSFEYWLALLRKSAPDSASSSKGLPKTKLSQYGKLCQEKKAWRDKSGTDRGSQSASVEHGQGTQGERTADAYGADGASSRRRRPEASRTRTGLESCHYAQREA